MKKTLLLFLLFSVLFSGCSAAPDALPREEEITSFVRENTLFLTDIAAEMKAFGEERIYVVLEEVEIETDEDRTATNAEKTSEMRLVRYVKKSGEHLLVESETIALLFEKTPLTLLYFQTAADGRECVVFSYGKETDRRVVGFTYSFDNAPCGFWGRKASFSEKKGRYYEKNSNGSAWFMTTEIEESFFYFEKEGNFIG